MSSLYITQQGATVRREGECLAVECDGQRILDMESHRLEHVGLFGHINLTTQAIELLLGKHIDVAFFTMDGRLKGRLCPPRPHNVTLRLEQFRRACDPAMRLHVAKILASAKIANGLEVLRRFAYNHPDLIPPPCLELMNQAHDSVPVCTSIESLLGIEGSAARAYFEGLAASNLSGLPFPGRVAHPPQGPVNALLSLGYVMLGGRIASLAEGLGLDAHVGFYHDSQDRRAALSLDILEVFRHPVVDRFCLVEFNRQAFTAADFSDGEYGTRLTPESLKRFLMRFDQWISRPGPTGRDSPLTEMRKQVEALCDWLAGREDLIAWRFKS